MAWRPMALSERGAASNGGLPCKSCGLAREVDAFAHELGCPEEDCGRCTHARRAHRLRNEERIGDVVVRTDPGGVECQHYPAGNQFIGRTCGCSTFVPTGVRKLRVTYRIDHAGDHVTLTLWSNGANIGRLCVREGERAIIDTIEVMLCTLLEATPTSDHVPERLGDGT